jgi:hypothetical protein
VLKGYYNEKIDFVKTSSMAAMVETEDYTVATFEKFCLSFKKQ